MMAGGRWRDRGQAGPSVGLVGKERGAPKTANGCREKPPTPAPGASPVRPGGTFVWYREWGRAAAEQVQPIGTAWQCGVHSGHSYITFHPRYPVSSLPASVGTELRARRAPRVV